MYLTYTLSERLAKAVPDEAHVQVFEPKELIWKGLYRRPLARLPKDQTT